jgi:hypothetical protein
VPLMVQIETQHSAAFLVPRHARHDDAPLLLGVDRTKRTAALRHVPEPTDQAALAPSRATSFLSWNSQVFMGSPFRARGATRKPTDSARCQAVVTPPAALGTPNDEPWVIAQVESVGFGAVAENFGGHYAGQLDGRTRHFDTSQPTKSVANSKISLWTTHCLRVCGSSSGDVRCALILRFGDSVVARSHDAIPSARKTKLPEPVATLKAGAHSDLIGATPALYLTPPCRSPRCHSRLRVRPTAASPLRRPLVSSGDVHLGPTCGVPASTQGSATS